MGWSCWRKLESQIKLGARFFPVILKPEMFRLFSSCPPADIPDVDIVPLYPPNTDVGVQSLVGTYTFTFNGKLDAERLRASLYDLIKYKWRILGARLVYNSKVFQKSLPYSHYSFLFVYFPDEKSRVPCSPYLRLVNAAMLI